MKIMNEVFYIFITYLYHKEYQFFYSQIIHHKFLLVKLVAKCSTFSKFKISTNEA